MKTKDSWFYPISIIGLLLIFTFGCEKEDPQDDHVKTLFTGGTGKQADPYVISTPKQLDGVRYNRDKHFKQQDDTGKGIPKTTVEMMQQSTFETWDFTNIWRINEGNSYPYLRWQE